MMLVDIKPKENMEHSLKKSKKKAKKNKENANITETAMETPSKKELKRQRRDSQKEAQISTDLNETAESDMKPVSKKKMKKRIKQKQKDDKVIENQQTFEVIGEDSKNKLPISDLVQPTWLRSQCIIDDVTALPLEELDFLQPEMRRALKHKLHITQLFPVQQTIIPWLLQAHAHNVLLRARDLCVSAPTGSGKTLAFAVPIVQLLSKRVKPEFRALIVLPVTELATQIYKVFQMLCEHTVLNVQLLSKSNAFKKEQELLLYKHKDQYIPKADILVTTPGRLIDHLHETPGFTLDKLQFIVIDEADRVVDAPFQNWLEHYEKAVRNIAKPHKLLFSATLTHNPEKLVRLQLWYPIFFKSVALDLQTLHKTAQQEIAQTQANVSKYITPKELTEKYCITEATHKPLTLFALITELKLRKFICFTNSAESSHRLTFVLNNLAKRDMKFDQLSAQMSAKERANSLNKFSRGKIDGLICSDALARGIDVQNVDYIVNYDLPRHIKTYIHRIGRTARAGRPGTALMLITKQEINSYKKLLAKLDKSLTSVQELARPATEEKCGAGFAKSLTALRYKLAEDKKKKMIAEKKAMMQNVLQQQPKTAATTYVGNLQQQIDMQMSSNL